MNATALLMGSCALIVIGALVGEPNWAPFCAGAAVLITLAASVIITKKNP